MAAECRRPRAISAYAAADLDALLTGEPAYRRRQLMQAVYRSPAPGFDQVSTLPKPLRDQLAAGVPYTSLSEPCTEQSLDGTRKTLFRAADGIAIEAVQMPSERGTATTVCLSSQAGCGMGCVFCATGALGLLRNLSAGEMVDQFLHFRRTSADRQAPDRVVFMGMGEPLANLPRVHEAVAILIDPARVGLGARHVTVSTIGLPVGIERLARWGWQIGLAISLHAPVDDLRIELVPLARQVSIADLMDASRAYQRLTGRRVTYEYLLLAGVTDSPSLAGELAGLLRGQRCHVNLIPFNPYPGARFAASSPVALRSFRDRLRRGGVPATIRRTRGRDISAACGQLHGGALAGGAVPASTERR